MNVKSRTRVSTAASDQIADQPPGARWLRISSAATAAQVTPAWSSSVHTRLHAALYVDDREDPRIRTGRSASVRRWTDDQRDRNGGREKGTESASARVTMNTIDANRRRERSASEQRVGRDGFPLEVAGRDAGDDEPPAM